MEGCEEWCRSWGFLKVEVLTYVDMHLVLFYWILSGYACVCCPHKLFSYVFCRHLRLWFFYLSSFTFICKLMKPQQPPPLRIDIMRSLRHPHIVELHFSFQDESHVYLGSWFAKKVSAGVFSLGHSWLFMHCQCCELGLQRFSNIYLPE